MTSVPAHGLTPNERFAAIPNEVINAALLDEGPDKRFTYRQSRVGEDTQSVAIPAQVRAIFTDPGLWAVASCLPNNRLYIPGHTNSSDPREGAPIHFPDYLMLVLVAMAGIDGIGTYRKAVTYLRDPKTWAEFVHHIDQYVPEGWTRLGELPNRRRAKKQSPLMLNAQTKTNRRKEARALRTTHGADVVHLCPKPKTEPPQPWHLDYWLKRWRGLRHDNEAMLPSDEYYGLRDNVIQQFRHVALAQAQRMGLLDPEAKFFYARPDRHQFVGYDGVVFKTPKKGNHPTAALYSTGTGPVHGTKFGITSARLFGLTHARVILDLHHIHATHPGSGRTEAEVLIEVMRRIVPESDYGVCGVLVDSAVRGQDVIRLHREFDAIVVNYPHAQSNPEGGAGRRLNPSRREKSALRHIARHIDATGTSCEHHIYAVGGEFLQLTQTADGTDTVKPVKRLKYLRNGGRTGSRREYLKVKLTCEWGEPVITRVPLFHTDPTSDDPAGTNWGETCRAYPPGSAEFKYLYGGRNDTEARHADLKARVKHLPRDLAGQELRLLGASLSMNALAWQAYLQALPGPEPNVLDNTA